MSGSGMRPSTVCRLSVMVAAAAAESAPGVPCTVSVVLNHVPVPLARDGQYKLPPGGGPGSGVLLTTLQGHRQHSEGG